MAIGQDIGMRTTGVNLAATGMQGAPNSFLNQLYQTAMDAFSKTSPIGTLGTEGDPRNQFAAAKYAPEGGILTNLSQGDSRRLSQGVHKNQWMADLMGETSGATGITALPTGTQTNIVPTAEPVYPSFDEQLKQKQDAWRAQNPEPAPMPIWNIVGTDLPASEAAGYDVPLFEETYNQGLINPDVAPRHAAIPDGYGDFFNSQFYDPSAMGAAVMTPVTLPTGETITFPDSESARQFQQYLDSRVWQAANGGIVGLDYLTRGL